jgi:hypothetical protein
VVLVADPPADVAAVRRLTHVVRDSILRPVSELAAGAAR